MYFDQFGDVRACCQNTDALLGNVREQSIREIWDSADTRRMRVALANDDYSEGCGFCGWLVEQGDKEIAYARVFDHLPVTQDDPRWPVQMEFSMSNACNLQCVMCNGDWSSSIRAHRENRPPLPDVYGEAFFDELAEFLPHLQKVNILGGEPFLGKEPLRVMEMLADLEHPPEVAVTTNGTQWSDRIERICQRLPLSFVVSLDGITKETYESVRVGADLDAVLENLDRFRGYARIHGTSVSLAHCLMRPNWREFSRLLRFAEDRGLRVGMNEVLFPKELSLFQMLAEELRPIVEELEQDRGGFAATLDRLRPVWDGQLQALRHRLEILEAGEHEFVLPWRDRTERPEEPWEERARRVLTDWTDAEAPVTLVIDEISGVTNLDGPPGHPLESLDLASVRAVDDLLAVLSGSIDGHADTSRLYSDLLADAVIRDRNGMDPREYRVAWRSDDVATVALIAMRWTLMPLDPISLLSETCSSDSIAVLTCDGAGRVIGVEGTNDAIEGRSESWLGFTLEEALVDLVASWGEPQLTAGPSGFVADSCISFVDDGGTTRLALRSLVDRGDDQTVIYLGQLQPASHVGPQRSVS
jgi:MoaA/NifB/PqqE/SkfB family radical SAM enzyme